MAEPESGFKVPDSDRGRFDKFKELRARLLGGETLSDDELGWYSSYSTTSDCMGWLDMETGLPDAVNQ